MSEHIRWVQSTGSGALVSTADAWAFVQAALTEPGALGPILIEFFDRPEMGRTVGSVHSPLYGWNGKAVAVLQTGVGTPDEHIVPIAFTGPGGSTKAPCAPRARWTTAR